MRWPDFGVAGAPVVIATPFGAPWPVVLVFGLAGLVVYGWVQYLRHKEHMRALDRAAVRTVAAVLRARATMDLSRSRPWQRRDLPRPGPSRQAS